MTKVVYDRHHHSGATPEARIAARKRNSGTGPDVKPDHIAEDGLGYSNVHDHGQGAGKGRGPRVGDKQQ